MTPPDLLTDLLGEHRRLIDAIDGNEGQLLGARPEGFEALAARRWAFTRELLMHCAHDEATVLRPLLVDRRSHVAAEAARSLAEQEQLIADFKEHVGRWGVFAGEAQWPEYVKATRALMHRVRRRLQSEENGVYRYLPAQRDETAPPPSPTPPPTHVRDARRIGEVIFRGKPLG